HFPDAFWISTDALSHESGVVLWHKVIGKGHIKNAGSEIDRIPNLADSITLVEERIQHLGDVLHPQIGELHPFNKVKDIILEQVAIALNRRWLLFPERVDKGF